jgi:hypothetical protein
MKSVKRNYTPLEALEYLQRTGISAEAAAIFNADVKRVRRASSLKRSKLVDLAWMENRTR